MSRALTLYLASTAAQRRLGAQWYPAALDICENIAEQHGIDTVNVVAAMAILSANTYWNHNVAMTRSLARRRRFSNPGTFPKTARKAWGALHGKVNENVRGPKTQAFARAIAGDQRAVVLDRQILKALEHWRISVTPRQYERYANQITRAADTVRVPPAIVQATLWIQERDTPTDSATLSLPF